MNNREYKPKRGTGARSTAGKRGEGTGSSKGRAPAKRSGKPSFGISDDAREKPSYGRRTEGTGRPSYGRRDDEGSRKAYGRRDEGGNKPSYGRREEGVTRPSYGRRDEGTARPSYGRRDEGTARPSYGRRDDEGSRKAYGRRDEGGNKPSYGRREEGVAKPSYGRKDDRDRKPASFSDKSKSTFKRKDPRSDKTAYKRNERKDAPFFVKSKGKERNESMTEYQDNMPEKDLFSENDRDDRIEGRNPVIEALKSDRPLNKIFIEKNNPDSILVRIAAMAREKAVPIQYVERRKLDMLSTTRIHQGVILEAAAHEYVEVSDILQAAEDKNQDPFIVILDGITDINNMGSIIRSAECAGAHGIIIPKRRSATLNATVAKVAAGAQEFVPVARVSNLAQTIRDLKEKGIWITGADMEGERPYYESDLKGPIVLVIGSEGEGISRVVKEECDYLVKIPMKGKISSLNAGVAAGLIMFEISKKRA